MAVSIVVVDVYLFTVDVFKESPALNGVNDDVLSVALAVSLGA